MQNAQPTTNCATRILKVDYLSISKQPKKLGVSEMQGSGTRNLTIRDISGTVNIRRPPNLAVMLRLWPNVKEHLLNLYSNYLSVFTVATLTVVVTDNNYSIALFNYKVE